MYRKILVAYDGSAASQKAFATACRMATSKGAELFILSVARPPDVADEVETKAVIENSRRHHRRMLDKLKVALAAKKLKAHLEVGVGHPAEQIIHQAERHQVDVIVVGDRGRSKFAKILLGSTSKQVVEHARLSVLVVR